MKNIFFTLLLIITIYSIYYDLNVGTLPKNTVVTSHSVDPMAEGLNVIPSESIVAEPGYTVLSIVEEINIGPINASIQQIIHDFETLNPETNASTIQTGKSYLFPIYNK